MLMTVKNIIKRTWSVCTDISRCTVSSRQIRF